MVKPLKSIEGFDYVGIGVIPCGEGHGTYILCKNLAEYDLTGIQIYRYHTFFRTMKEVDELEDDTRDYVFCVKRADLV